MCEFPQFTFVDNLGLLFCSGDAQPPTTNELKCKLTGAIMFFGVCVCWFLKF